jgi:hypothetical protein
LRSVQPYKGPWLGMPVGKNPTGGACLARAGPRDIFQLARDIPATEVRLVMVRGIRPAGAASRAALAAIAVGAIIVLAGCGSAVAGGRSASAGGPGASPVPGGKASAGVALCIDIPKLTSVAVSRTMALHAVQPDLVLPRGITIREPLLVRDLATALCGLPKSPRGPVNCPPQLVGSLRLGFAAGGRLFRPVTIQVSGCQVVRGLGPARTVPSSAFWRTLGKDLGFKFARSMSQPGGINP